MSIAVEFEEPFRGPFEPWTVEQVPAVGDQVDIMPEGGSGTDDEVVATVTRREWYKGGAACVCHVDTR